MRRTSPYGNGSEAHRAFQRVTGHKTIKSYLNQKRHPDYMNLKKKINACTKPDQLERLREVTIAFNSSVVKTKNKVDGTDLMCLWLNKYDELNPESIHN